MLTVCVHQCFVCCDKGAAGTTRERKEFKQCGCGGS